MDCSSSSRSGFTKSLLTVSISLLVLCRGIVATLQGYPSYQKIVNLTTGYRFQTRRQLTTRSTWLINKFSSSRNLGKRFPSQSALNNSTDVLERIRKAVNSHVFNVSSKAIKVQDAALHLLTAIRSTKQVCATVTWTQFHLAFVVHWKLRQQAIQYTTERRKYVNLAL